ncbi:HNH endonuclease [Pontivivens insulae]|uniref:HNH domain-containing protein n=1 Tax=Pontivivens insulae TaxID=1639689 RepID=A0A2R8AF85_9RHOB|nr:hypothetical protein [Pontivivens insulae]RED11964.1 hypothetical protein DFR53_2676 [Pontivivens insulae]SPF30720.1 hypothetical protein POI8812_03062 [Pontivivens insulae]
MKPVLLCRPSWRATYRSLDEPFYTSQSYPLKHGVDMVALNMWPWPTGFMGHIPNRDQSIDIGNLGATSSADYIDGVLVIWCARPKNGSEMVIVGFYDDARVFRSPQEHPELTSELGHSANYQAQSRKAVLIPENERHFTIPSALTKGKVGMGQRNIFHGLNSSSNWYRSNLESRPIADALRQRIYDYVEDMDAHRLPDTAPHGTESRVAKKSISYEGRVDRRVILNERGYRCEACGWHVAEEHRERWASGLDVHHLLPYSALGEGEEREVDLKDFLVLCAPCHRAIHKQTDHSDTRLIANDPGRPNQ